MKETTKISGYDINPALQQKKYKLTPASKEFVEKGRKLITEKLIELPSL